MDPLHNQPLQTTPVAEPPVSPQAPVINQVPVTPVYQAPVAQPVLPVTQPVAPGTLVSAIGTIQVPSPVAPQSSHWKKVVLVLVLLSLMSGGAYAMYVYKDTIKAHLPYFGDDVVFTESNFTSSLMNMFKTIDGAEYTVNANIFIVDREKNTMSMDSKMGPSPEKLASYKNDYNRVQLISSLTSMIRRPTFVAGKSTDVYPKDLNELKKMFTDRYKGYSSSQTDLLNDPAIAPSISYRVINNGDDFELSVTFETDEAITAINDSVSRYSSYSYSESQASSTLNLKDKTLILSKGSSSYIYIPNEMKRPLLSQLGFYLKDLPQDFFISGTSSVLSKNTEGKTPEVKTELVAEGNFSDLTYKLGFDTVLKDKAFYYHINNFPALGLFGGLATLKGKWVKVDMATSSATSTMDHYNGDTVGQMSLSVQEGLEKNKDTTKKLMEAFAKSADASSLITFTQQPIHEKLKNENVTKYQFFVKKEALTAFLDAFEKETTSDPDIKKYFSAYKKELNSVMASPDFNEIYDYSKENIFLTIWTRKDGMPIQAQMRLRIIPSIESKNLKEKQIELVITMMLSKINETILIETPKDAKTYTEIMGISSSRGY
jgi:hypothetical protein